MFKPINTMLYSFSHSISPNVRKHIKKRRRTKQNLCQHGQESPYTYCNKSHKLQVKVIDVKAWKILLRNGVWTLNLISNCFWYTSYLIKMRLPKDNQHWLDVPIFFPLKCFVFLLVLYGWNFRRQFHMNASLMAEERKKNHSMWQICRSKQWITPWCGLLHLSSTNNISHFITVSGSKIHS